MEEKTTLSEILQLLYVVSVAIIIASFPKLVAIAFLAYSLFQLYGDRIDNRIINQFKKLYKNP